jgi:hypothetical protein
VNTLKPIQSSAAVRAWYRRRLQALARSMAVELLGLVREHYSAPAVVEPVLLAAPPSLGAGPATVGTVQAMDDVDDVALHRALADWGIRWESRFNRMSAGIARLFTDRSRRYLDATFRRRLRQAGFTVRFAPSDRMVAAYRAVAAENVGLIRSVPRQFHQQVEKAVRKAVMKGGALGELSKEIRRQYGATYRRAALIARDQNAKAKAVLENARRQELGIKEAIWIHSHAGKVPRPEHVRWGREKKRYELDKGMWSEVDQAWVWPGTPINCRCVSRSVIPDAFERASERAAARRGLNVQATP